MHTHYDAAKQILAKARSFSRETKISKDCSVYMLLSSSCIVLHSSYGSGAPLLLPPPTGSLINFTICGRTPWTRDQLVARPLPTQDNTIQRPRTNMYALTGTRTRDPVYERSRPTSQTAQPLDRLCCLLTFLNINVV
jgi:hypothetical protein